MSSSLAFVERIILDVTGLKKRGRFFLRSLGSCFFERPRLNASVPAFKRNACLSSIPPSEADFKPLCRFIIQMKLLVEEVPKSPTWGSTGLGHFFRESPSFSMAIFNMGKKYLGTYSVSGFKCRPRDWYRPSSERRRRRRLSFFFLNDAASKLSLNCNRNHQHQRIIFSLLSI